MPDTTNTLPEQIIETSRAFTQTLKMENTVFEGQLNSSIEMTLHSFRELITICKEAIAIGQPTPKGQKTLGDTAQQALSNIQNAASQANESSAAVAAAAPTSATGTELETQVLQAVAQSYENAVNAQKQMYITQQAATTQLITIILSVATATLGIAVKEAESKGK